ncbi:MAG: hypothetical protein IJ438_09870 [Clostridia bacterium]|nr:hypothetical protein [Clostridia bacterium]
MLYLIVGVVILMFIAEKHQKKKKAARHAAGISGFKRIGRAILAGIAAFFVFVLLVGDKEDKSSMNEQSANTSRVTAMTESTKVTVTQNPTATPIPTATCMPEMTKPGISGSNAYDITVTLEDMGFNIGKRQETATKDGYVWYISGIIDGTSYVAHLETNREYEIYDATFMMTGTDATYLPWAATLPHELAEQDSTVSWVKQQQDRKETGSITVGDAIWTYTPSKIGGTLRVQCVDAAAYADAKLDQMISDE